MFADGGRGGCGLFAGGDRGSVGGGGGITRARDVLSCGGDVGGSSRDTDAIERWLRVRGQWRGAAGGG